MRFTGSMKLAAVVLALTMLVMGLAACSSNPTTTTSTAPAYSVNMMDMPDGMSDYLTKLAIWIWYS